MFFLSSEAQLSYSYIHSFPSSLLQDESLQAMEDSISPCRDPPGENARY